MSSSVAEKLEFTTETSVYTLEKDSLGWKLQKIALKDGQESSVKPGEDIPSFIHVSVVERHDGQKVISCI